MHGERSRGLNRARSADWRGQQAAAGGLVDLGPAVERVEDDRVVGLAAQPAVNADEKMAGERDAEDVQAGAARHVHVDDRERDRDPHAPFDHDVEQAVAEVVVVPAIAGEMFVLVQEPVERRDAQPHGRVAKRPKTPGGAAAEPLE